MLLFPLSAILFRYAFTAFLSVNFISTLCTVWDKLMFSPSIKMAIFFRSVFFVTCVIRCQTVGSD